MTWAKIAAADTGCETPTKGHSMTWHCDFQPENQAFIENFSLDLAKAKQWSDISIRAGGRSHHFPNFPFQNASTNID
jgi:hypothetical protein